MASHDIWGTPLDFFKVVDDEFHFDLDAAATASDTLCERYITPEQDALKTPWDGKNVWCNPPYGAGSTGSSGTLESFIARGFEQSNELHNTVVMLLPAYTDPKYWSNYVMRAHEVRFLKGRLKFRDNLGTATMSARFPSVLVIFKWLKGETFGKSPNIFNWDWRK
jgi:phage N-6-adenine-methyltransferase